MSTNSEWKYYCKRCEDENEVAIRRIKLMAFEEIVQNTPEVGRIIRETKKLIGNLGCRYNRALEKMP